MEAQRPVPGLDALQVTNRKSGDVGKMNGAVVGHIFMLTGVVPETLLRTAVVVSALQPGIAQADDADIVLFLYRDGYYEREKGAETVNAAIDQNSGECIVAKNRHGETTSVKLHWQGEFMRFTGVDHGRE